MSPRRTTNAPSAFARCWRATARASATAKRRCGNTCTRTTRRRTGTTRTATATTRYRRAVATANTNKTATTTRSAWFWRSSVELTPSDFWLYVRFAVAVGGLWRLGKSPTESADSVGLLCWR